MIIQPEVACIFAYLSGLDSSGFKIDSEAKVLEEKFHLIPDAWKPWINFYLDYFQTYQLFPPFSRFSEAAQMENEVSFEEKDLQQIYISTFSTWESDYLANKMLKAPLAERREILLKMSQVLSADTQVSVPLDSVDSFSVEGAIIKKESGGKRFFDMFTQHLNNTCIVNPGTVISIIGNPGAGKSQTAINLAYLNSVLGNLNSLYIYLENTMDAYNIELLSRHSYTNGMLIENASLKRGIDPDEAVAVKKIMELQESFKADKKGNIYFASFSKFSPEPLRFANQLGKYVNENGIQVVILDYLQRCKSYTPLKWDSREYINQVMSAFSSCALGSFGSDPFVAVMLSQPTRAAEEKMLKTKGVGMSIFDAVEAPSIERDSFIVMGLYADPSLRSNQNMVYKILKNRDQAADISTVLTTALPQYCFIGDIGSGQSTPTFTQEDAKSMMDLDIF